MTLPTYLQLIEKQKISVPEFYTLFSNEDECLELYFQLLYNDQKCQKCGRGIVDNYTRISRKNTNGIPKKAYRCKSCKTHIYPLSNSIFRQSTVPLPQVFFMIYMVCINKSISPMEISTTIGITYKTAFRLMMLLRTAMFTHHTSLMSGIIEIDEAFIGTGSKMYNWSGISTRKEPIMGLVERGTKNLRLFLVKNRSADTINKLIKENIQVGSTIYTDSWKGYSSLSKYYIHETVDHSAKEYVRGEVYTNTIENVWGVFKRNLRKSHVKISNQHVQLYLNEACWRHNSKGKRPMQLFNEILIRTSFLPVWNNAIT